MIVNDAAPWQGVQVWQLSELQQMRSDSTDFVIIGPTITFYYR